MNTDRIIQNISKVISLTTEEIVFFISLLEKNTYKKKDFIIRSGEVCRKETYVVKGCFKIFYVDNDGTEHSVKFAVEDWWTLDLESFAMQTPAFYSIQALEDSEVLQISKANHDLLYERIPKFEKFGRLRFQQSYILLQHRMTQNLYADAEEKLKQFNQKYPGLDQRIPQKEIAAYLGITPEFLSMLRRKKMPRSIS